MMNGNGGFKASINTYTKWLLTTYIYMGFFTDTWLKGNLIS